jgi:type IV pilus biogenesis protein CpaD/CtpE
LLRTNPPGCANAYNLQRMVVQEDDLVYGRELDPAVAAPAARAAQRYIDGRTDPVLGGGVRENRLSTSENGTMTEE